MEQYFVTYTREANAQLDTIYTDKRAYVNATSFTETFKSWNYTLLQYLRPSTFCKVKSRGTIPMKNIGEFDYYIVTVREIHVVVITYFHFNYLPFTNNVKKIEDAGYGYSIVQDSNSQKVAIRKPNNKPLTNFVFDSIIGFHHSKEDYNNIHAIGFIGNRVYSIPLYGEPTLLHISKNDYLSMKHRYDETFRRKLKIIIENVIGNYISNKEILYKSMKRKTLTESGNAVLCPKKKALIRLTENDLYHIIKKCVKEIIGNDYDWDKYTDVPIAHNTIMQLADTKRFVKSLVALCDRDTDPNEWRWDIIEDDGCYAICNNREIQRNMYIFPELHKALKELPNLPPH